MLFRAAEGYQDGQTTELQLGHPLDTSRMYGASFWAEYIALVTVAVSWQVQCVLPSSLNSLFVAMSGGAFLQGRSLSKYAVIYSWTCQSSVFSRGVSASRYTSEDISSLLLTPSRGPYPFGICATLGSAFLCACRGGSQSRNC